jgi:hypothetical protein
MSGLLWRENKRGVHEILVSVQPHSFFASELPFMPCVRVFWRSMQLTRPREVPASLWGCPAA